MIKSSYFVLLLESSATVCPESESDGIIWNKTPAGYTNFKDCAAEFTGYHICFSIVKS